MAGEKEEFVRKSAVEMMRRRNGLKVETAVHHAEEMWASAKLVSQWFKYKLDPRITLTRWCIESNGANEIANRTDSGKRVPFHRWSAGMFHMRMWPFVQELEALEIPYNGPIAQWVLDHPIEQIRCVSRFQCRWLESTKGDNVAMIEIYRYGVSFNGRSQYFKDFNRVYKGVWGREVPKR